MLFIVSAGYDHHFVCSKALGYYDKGGRESGDVARFMAKNPGGQVIWLRTEKDYDASEAIYADELPQVLDGKAKVEDFGFEITRIVDSMEDL